MYQVIGKPACGQCTQVKQMFDQYHVPYEYKVIGQDITREEVMASIPPSVRELPVIMQDAEFIGGLREAQQIVGGA